MRVPIRLGAGLVLAAALAGCGTGTAPYTPDPLATAAPPGPPAGSRAEAAALAGQLLSRLDLPPGASRLPPEPLSASLREPASGCECPTTYIDVHQVFAGPQPVASVVTALEARAPAGMAVAGYGGGGGLQEVDYTVHQVPAGIAGAQVELTVAAGPSGGSLLRADAQVTWYPPRTFAEYIDPAYYHALTIAVTVYGREVHTVHAVVTSQAVIARLAEALDQSQAQPPGGIVVCPAISAIYQLAFSVWGNHRPAVMVSGNQLSCGGTGITVAGKTQPALDDQGTVAVIVDQVLHLTP